MDFARPNSMHLCLYTLLIILSSLLLPSAFATTPVSCLPDQSYSLLQLKRGFFHSDLTSWQPGTDCCHGWEGVSCDKATAHVTALDISNRNIEGNLSAAIFNLTSLQHLNLAYNNFSQNQIPVHGFEKLTMLTHLNLSHTYFFFDSQVVPIAIANLKNLISLDLSWSYLKLHKPNLQILVSQLSNLRELYLDSVDISENGTEWCRALSESVPHLQVLSMVQCNLSGPIEPSLSQLSSLTVLCLSDNSLQTQIPDYFAEFPLKELLLDGSDLKGPFPHEIFRIPTLTKLDLSQNGELFGTLPNFQIVSSLESLVLYETNFFGSIPDSIGNLRNLSELNLSNCNFSGQIPSSIEKLGKLARLDLSSNSFSGSIPPSLFSLPNLEELYLSNNKLSGQFRLKEDSFIFSPLIVIGLDNNQLDGSIPWKIYKFSHLEKLYLSMNQFSRPIPNPIVWPSSLRSLDLSSNNFNETFDINLLEHLSNLTYLGLQDNQITGEIPSSICELNLIVLDLSSNNLSGSIPSCIIGSRYMKGLSLRGNKLSGILSPHISRSCALVALDLNNNNLEGNLPRSLTKCKDLAFLDIGNNQIGGTFPFSLAKLPNLQVIILRSNRFYGTLGFPSKFRKMNSPFPLLRIIDLASNNFNGSLPPLWFNIFKSMQNLSSDAILEKGIVGIIWISVTITDKGEQMTLENNLPNLMMSIDLSTNRFTGDIPKTIGELKGLQVLNLSHNAFTGSIPHRLGQLTQIESMDLSWNQLSGEIPQELMSLNFLSTLNLSFNHLVGRIPQSKQFLTFENSSFEGNPGLCGVPLSKLCNVQIPGNNSTSPSTKPAKKMTAIVLLCLFIGLGFGTGFAIAIVIPVIKRARNARASR